MFLTLNAKQNYLSFLCYRLNILHEHSKTHVYSLNFLCLLFSTTKCTVYRWKTQSLWWWVVRNCSRRFSYTQRDVLHVMSGRARLYSYQCMYRSNPHLEVFQGFQMILLNSWAYLQDLVNGKYCRFSPPYGPPPSLLPSLQKQSGTLPYHCCSLLPSNNSHESRQDN